MASYCLPICEGDLCMETEEVQVLLGLISSAKVATDLHSGVSPTKLHFSRSFSVYSCKPSQRQGYSLEPDATHGSI